ncbi:two-component system, OmpR family, phosphate regulon sensor histidine kinase PhoR [Thermoflexales bacterium]|nr:two-component system, OmpR family, phosphate regulon sensor histidine kinase PhoR [Thermoflexales bacterium]
MMVIPLKVLIFCAVLVLIGSVLLAVYVDRRRRRKYLLAVPLVPVFEGAPVGVLVLDSPTTYHHVNALACTLLALPERCGTLPSGGWGDLLRADFIQATQQAGQAQQRLVNVTAEQRVRWSVSVVEGEAIVLLADASQAGKIERASRLFLSELAHEIQTPLTAIVAHAGVLRSPETPPDTREVSINLIEREAYRASRLARDLLELSRLESASDEVHKPIDLVVLVEEVVAQVILAAEDKQLELSLQAEANLPHISGHADQLQRAFLNLLDNSVKYCQPGDRIDVILHRAANGVSCAVHDSGPGIPAQHLPHLTQRLYRGRTDVEGSGLGLSIVEEVLRRHQAQLKIESRSTGDHTGTRVQFVLPLA